MDGTRFDALLRSVVAGRSRRGLLAGLSGGVLVALPHALGVEQAAAKKKKKKRGNSPPTCAQRCPAALWCLSRAADSTLCGNGSFANCTPCSSDQDCLGVFAGSGRIPYCVTASTSRSTGVTTRMTGPGSSCAGVTSPGVCADVFDPA